MRKLHVSTTWICDGICLYVLIMTKRMSALVALILIPSVFALIGGFYADMGYMMLEGSKISTYWYYAYVRYFIFWDYD